jgi:hypothetical protein
MGRVCVSVILLLALVMLSAGDVGASTLIIPTTTLNADSNVFGFSPVSFTVSSDYLPSDVVSVTATGQANLATGSGYGPFLTNAAGIIQPPLGPAYVAIGLHLGDFYLGPDGFRYASVLIGNSSLGYHELFPADASTGLGSGSPPSDISTTRTLNDLFGQGLAAGTVLELSIYDINTYDNAGSFVLSAVPEPATLLLWSSLGAVGLVIAWRKRNRAA